MDGSGPEVTIAGGGLAGAAFGCLLQAARREAGLPPPRLLVVERGAPPSAELPNFDSPSVALSRRSVQIFQHIGLWQALAPRAAPVCRVRVCQAGYPGGTLQLDCRLNGWDSLSFQVESPLLLRTLWHALKEGGAELRTGVSVTAPSPLPGGGFSLNLEGQEEHTALFTALLVAADGPHSPLRKALGIGTITADEPNSILLANIAVAGSPPPEVWEYFLPDGALVLLPMPPFKKQGRMLAIRVASEERCAALAGQEEPQFLAELQAIFGEAPRLLRAGVRRVQKLQVVHAAEQVRRGLVLLGQSAHSLHPAGAQGFNLALRDAEILAQFLTEAHLAGQPGGDLRVLQRYAASRSADQHLTAALTRALAPRRHPLPWVRGPLISLLRLAPPLQSLLMRRAAGF